MTVTEVRLNQADLILSNAGKALFRTVTLSILKISDLNCFLSMKTKLSLGHGSGSDAASLMTAFFLHMRDAEVFSATPGVSLSLCPSENSNNCDATHFSSTCGVGERAALYSDIHLVGEMNVCPSEAFCKSSKVRWDCQEMVRA